MFSIYLYYTTTTCAPSKKHMVDLGIKHSDLETRPQFTRGPQELWTKSISTAFVDPLFSLLNIQIVNPFSTTSVSLLARGLRALEREHYGPTEPRLSKVSTFRNYNSFRIFLHFLQAFLQSI